MIGVQMTDKDFGKVFVINTSYSYRDGTSWTLTSSVKNVHSGDWQESCPNQFSFKHPCGGIYRWLRGELVRFRYLAKSFNIKPWSRGKPGVDRNRRMVCVLFN